MSPLVYHNRGVFVALLAEGVDRNCTGVPERISLYRSPSSRRAWIEIETLAGWHQRPAVALLAEGVDRNNHNRDSVIGRIMSPSSRRAWIEIGQRKTPPPTSSGRPPRGGRG